MKRKNLFLFPILILISTLCFINVSCFSGFQEKGELSITFTESTIRQIMARGADISEEQEGTDFDIPSFDFLDNGTLMAEYVGYASGGKDVFALYVFTNNKYAVYSATKMSEIDYSKYEEMATIEDYTSLVSDPDYIKLLTDPYSILDPAVVSKGSWAQSGSSILITETHYMSAASGKLTEVSNPSVIATIPQDAKYFTVQSNSGYVITFYTSTKEEDYYDDEPVESAKLLVRVVAGNIAYEKTLPVYYNTKAAHVEFTDLPVGVTAKVSALVYFDYLGEEREIYANGESDEFVIQAGTNTTSIILKMYNGGDDPNDDPVEDKFTPPSGTPSTILEGDGIYDEHGESNNRKYLLALYRTNEYAIYEYSSAPNISATTDSSEILSILKSGLLISYGKYKQTSTMISYTENAFYDYSDAKYREGTASGDWSWPTQKFKISTGSGIMVEFKYGGSSEEADDTLTPPTGNISDCFPGTAVVDSNTVNYVLVLYDSNKYSIYEFSKEFLENGGKEFAFSSDSTREEKLEIISRMLNYGTVISFGSYSVSVAENDAKLFNYNESAYWNKNSKKYIASTFKGSCSFTEDLSIQVGGSTGYVITFGSYESGSENKLLYTAQTKISEEYLSQFNGGWLYFNALSDGTYSIYANIYGEGAQDPEDKYFAKGTWELQEDSGEYGSLKLTETEYYDFASDELISGGNKQTVVDLSKSKFSYNSSTGLELEFTLNTETESYPFSFSIKGFDKNDVTDIDGDKCNVTLYTIKDASVMQTIKSTLANEKITDAQKAEVLIPIIEDSLNSAITAFQPGVNYSSHSGAPTNEVLNDGTIKWEGTVPTSVKEGKTYGVLATVYFSKEYNSGCFYEFDIGYAENLKLSSDSNVVELTVSGMNIPCNINFYYDGAFDSDYTVRTALTDIVMFNKDESIRESVLNEIFAAVEDSNTALKKKGYEFNTNINPVCDIQDGVPFVTLYYIYNPEQGGDDPIDEPDDPVEETPTTNVDVELEESASNLTELNLSYTSSTDDYGQNCYIVSLDETNPDVSGYTLTWTIDGVAENETGSQLVVYDALLSIGKHSVTLLAVSTDGKKICAGNTSINITREKESRVAFVSTNRGIEFRVNRFTTDTYFENMEIVEAESNISVKTEFETSLSGWTGYWPFVEPNKEYTFILKGKIGESTAIEEYYQVPVEYKGTRNSPITEEVLSNIKQFKQQSVSLTCASGDACVSYEQSTGKELTNMFASIQGVTVSSSHLQLDLYEQTDKGWSWYTLCEYSENGFIPDSISGVGVIENSEEWGKTNALENIQNGAQLFVTMQPVYVLNGDNSQYFEIDYLTSNTITYEK